MEPYFKIENLQLNYKGFEGTETILNIDEIAIQKGEAYGIVGESGAGKTVLALTIQKLLATPPGEIVSGKIFLNGDELLSKSEREMKEIRGKRIAMIFQDPMSTLNPVYTIGEQMINVIMKHQSCRKKVAQTKALALLDKVNLPDASNALGKYPHELSGGQRQRVIIAMALSCGADFFIADEPTRNLDVTIQAGILKLLKNLQDELGVTLLFIANNLGIIATACDRVGILKEGEIVETGTVDEVLHHPHHDYTKLLIKSMDVKKMSSVNIKDNDVLIKIDQIKKYFPVNAGFLKKPTLFVKAVDDVSLEIRKGEVVGIVGESGCGKSTLVNTVLNLHEPTEGQVVFDGKSIYDQSKSNLRKLRKHIQIVFQDPFWSLNPRMIVKDIIGEPLKVHEKLSDKDYTSKVENIMERVGLRKEEIYWYPHEFSGGQRQRIAIARALTVNPKLMVLDEPTSSIDVVSQAYIMNLLEDLRKELGLTYIVISHDLSVVHAMSDRIVVMYLGKIVEMGDADQVFNTPKHPYTKALFNAIPSIHTKSVNDLSTIEGPVPSAINPPSGCRFRTRCPFATERCAKALPELQDFDGHEVACHIFDKERPMEVVS